MIKERLHFHTIDALRFFAFLKVYFMHIPIQGHFPIFEFFKRRGGIGVEFFFVLSGFLITYILVNEKTKGELNIRRFLFNRALRIWPLFYVMLFAAFLLPYDFLERTGMHMVGGGYDPDWRFSFSFLENYKMIIMDNSPKTTPLPVMWSLCIEEHFYILWCFLIACIPFKKLPYLFAGSILIANISRIVSPILIPNVHIDTNEILTNIDLFAIGGLLGYFTVKDYNKLAVFIGSIPDKFKLLNICIVITIVLFEPEIFETTALGRIIQPTIMAILFTSVLAVFVPLNSKIKISTSNIFSKLGRISYGLYIYHIIFIHMLLKYFMDHYIVLDNWSTLSLFMLITLASTILTSYVSYNYFEKSFLRLKR